MRVVRLGLAELVLLRRKAIGVHQVLVALAELVRRDVIRQNEPAQRLGIVVDEV